MTLDFGKVPEKKLWNVFFAHSATGANTLVEQAAETLVKAAFTERIHGRTKVVGRALFVV
jgi:hypothetical protein